MSKINDNLSEIFDIEPIQQVEVLPAIVNKSNTELVADEVESDAALARKNIKGLLDKGGVAIDNLLLVAQESEHPRAYEVAANFIKTLSDLNKDLLEIQKQKQSLRPQEITNSINVERAVFVGSTAELLKQIRENK
jgi:predicted transcriptional regulator